jgi:peptide-methionine (R)-S-oxide reductase
MKRLMVALVVVCGMMLAGAGCEGPRDGVAAADAGGPSGGSATTQSTGGKVEKIVKSNQEWKKELPAETYHVMREAGTERPFRNEYFNNHEKGTYVCAACGLELYGSDAKFESGTGWPSFWKPIAQSHVDVNKDADGERDEVKCARCGGHLGHVFDDGPKPTGLRYCMNSAAMKFVPAKEK